MKFWESWYLAQQVIETVKGDQIHEWMTPWAVLQFRANEAEKKNLVKVEVIAE